MIPRRSGTTEYPKEKFSISNSVFNIHDSRVLGTVRSPDIVSSIYHIAPIQFTHAVCVFVCSPVSLHFDEKCASKKSACILCVSTTSTQ